MISLLNNAKPCDFVTLSEHLRALDLRWPPADFDVEAEQERLAAS